MMLLDNRIHVVVLKIFDFSSKIRPSQSHQSFSYILPVSTETTFIHRGLRNMAVYNIVVVRAADKTERESRV